MLETQYLKSELAEGISCFKYLEGDYGSGKSQFIQCLAGRAHSNGIVSAIVTIGQECPFSSPGSIYRKIMASFVPPPSEDFREDEKGIEILVRSWIRKELRSQGITPGNAVPEEVVRHVRRTFDEPYLGASDMQTGVALRELGRRLLRAEAGADLSPADMYLVSCVG